MADKTNASERLTALNQGLIETKNLAECLAIDQARLASAVLPALGLKKSAEKIIDVAEAARRDGISRQMAQIGAAIAESLRSERRRDAMLSAIAAHPSDTVRSWAAFVIARAPEDIPVKARLLKMRPFAADSHFGVREWSWIAVRPHLAADVTQAIRELITWTGDDDPNIRRFSVESIRPRGVWCEHIKELKAHPEYAEELLDRLCADPSRYVQDSVSNWINDASKSQPEWAMRLCHRWQSGASEHTKRIISRALRTLKKKEMT